MTELGLCPDSVAGVDINEMSARLRLVTRAAARASGLSEGSIAHRIAPEGRWQRVLPGIYATHCGTLTPSERHVAALLYAGPAAVLGGPTVASLVGLRTVPRSDAVHILLPHTLHRRSTGFVRVRRTIHMPAPRSIAGYPCAPVARAVVDSCRLLRRGDEVRALVAEAVQRGRATVDALTDELASGGSAGSGITRRVLDEVADGVRSPAEGAAYRLLRRSPLPRALWNCAVRVDGVALGSPDAYWVEQAVALEVDSRRWHLGPREWERTMARHARFTAAGIAVVHVSPTRIRDDPDGVLADVAATLAGRRGVGRVLPISVRAACPEQRRLSSRRGG